MLEWLNEVEKEEKLLNLRQEISDKDIDRNFIPYLNRFNTMPDVCTTQCCTGHIRKVNGTSESKPGYLSLRFSFHMEAYFKYHALKQILDMPSVIMAEENYEVFGDFVRQRTVIWFKHRDWRDTVETILGHTQKAYDLMKEKT